MTTTFDFSKAVIPAIVKRISLAQAYVRIAIFQLHNDSVINALNQKLKEKVRVEILMLPYDSINRKIRPTIQPKLEQLEMKGAKIYFNKWNVGDPSRTTTAVGRWYSFHGKFIVTEKCAIALSANLTEHEELDAIITFDDDSSRIQEFNQQFERLVDLFVTKKGSSDGEIRQKIMQLARVNTEKVFELPKNIGQEHRNHWIRQYPSEVCSLAQDISERLYLTPFDYIGREILTRLVNEADEFVYISTETFTDSDFSEFLVSIAVNKKIEIKILTGGTSMDFTDRMENMLRELLAHGIDVRVTDEDLHAKLLVTDKSLVVSSINLNKINLGFTTTKNYCTENTESAFVSKTPDVIKIAKEKYTVVLKQSQSVEARLVAKLETTVKKRLSGTFGLQTSPDARNLFARFILTKQIENRQILTKIGKIIKKLMAFSKRDKVEKQDFISAIILYYLSERKQDIANMKEKIQELDNTVNVASAINGLEFSGFIERDGDYFKINIEALFS